MYKNKKLLISSGGIRVIFNLPVILAKQISISQFLYNYIPCVTSSEVEETDIQEKIPHIQVLDNKSNNVLIRIDEQNGLIRLNLDKVSIQDLITLIDHVLEYYRQIKGIYCVHGSAVSFKGAGIWFLGAVSGLGKTTSAVNLCFKKDFKFIGDEKILIDSSLNILGGVRKLNYNKSFLNNSIKTNLDGKNERELNRIIKMEKSIVPFRLGIVPILFKGAKISEIDKWENKKIDFHIYEELSRKIRGVSRRVSNFSIPVGSVDSENLAFNRSLLSKKVAQQIPFFLIKGTEEDIYETIIENCS